LSVFHLVRAVFGEAWSSEEVMAIRFLSNGAAVFLRNRYDKRW